jgi:NAD(P)-dependent dehydrogenase (short-subunit alcohol dehydrogenase family)
MTEDGRPLEGKVVVVTGAASGIGAATVHHITTAGGAVIAVDRSASVQELRVDNLVEPVTTDAADEAAIERAVGIAGDKFGRLDGAVAVAGITRAGTVETMSLSEWESVLRVNLTSVFLLAKAAVPAFRKAGGGSFVAVASQVGLVGYPENVAYCAAKAGAINLVRAMTVDHAGERIRANAVCPGPVDTPMLREGFAQTGETYDLAASRVPMSRIGKAEEIAATIGFLLSDAAAFVSGAAWVVDGGYTAH